MRILTLLIGVSAGAYMMLRLTTAMPDPARSCLPDLVCAVGESLSTPAEPSRPGLRVVVYDPVLEPRERPGVSRTTDDLAWRSDDVVTGHLAVARTEADSPSGFRILPMGQPGARGVCAAFDGRRLHCLALLNPPFEERRAVPR
ncbi:hypothetical protein [Brevundimonas sp.]|uniref:hypothetical protein n=1 Tax=Brevundimonas sp. TaxID=1871086 RepID=UPI0039193776